MTVGDAIAVRQVDRDATRVCYPDAPLNDRPEGFMVRAVLLQGGSGMRRFSAAAALLLAALIPSIGPSIARADSIAVIAGVRGKVEVTAAKGGAPQRAVLGRPLERGDQVKVAGGGAATLFFNDGNVLELAPGSSVRVAGQVGKGGKSGVSSDVFKSVSKFVAGGSRETGLIALSQLRSGPVAGDAPILIAPRRTALLADRPDFTWRAVPGASRYRVTLSSAEGGELWKREVTGVTLLFPTDAAALAGSVEYLWEVQAFSDTKPLRSESSVFQVLPAAEAAAVRLNLGRIAESTGGAESAAARFLAGSYLSGLGLYLDAGEQFAALSKLEPSAPEPHQALGDVYSSVGLMDLAAAEFQMALSLAREP
jgi:hypothetical protein